jgi:ATP-dependent DNA helicase RecQ
MACDICLGDTENVADADVVAQKILSCVARVQERFGINHVAGILRGENTDRIRQCKHDQLTTFGLLKGCAKPTVREWIYQLISQAVLVQEGDEYPILRLNEASWAVMRKQRSVKLLQPRKRKKDEEAARSRADDTSWEGVDRDLFEELRLLRRMLAEERQVSSYIIFSDATLRELARARPSTLDNMRLIYGVGDAKLRDYGDRFLQIVVRYSREHALPTDLALPPRPPPRSPAEPGKLSAVKLKAFDLFRAGAVIVDVMHQTERARSTINDYLAEFIRRERPPDIRRWVADDVYERVAAATRQVGRGFLKPIFVALGETISYDDIRLVLAHLASKES